MFDEKVITRIFNEYLVKKGDRPVLFFGKQRKPDKDQIAWISSNWNLEDD